MSSITARMGFAVADVSTSGCTAQDLGDSLAKVQQAVTQTRIAKRGEGERTPSSARAKTQRAYQALEQQIEAAGRPVAKPFVRAHRRSLAHLQRQVAAIEVAAAWDKLEASANRGEVYYLGWNRAGVRGNVAHARSLGVPASADFDRQSVLTIRAWVQNADCEARAEAAWSRSRSFAFRGDVLNTEIQAREAFDLYCQARHPTAAQEESMRQAMAERIHCAKVFADPSTT